MRVRTQRTHQTGLSNRTQKQSQTSDIFQQSYTKSQSFKHHSQPIGRQQVFTFAKGSKNTFNTLQATKTGAQLPGIGVCNDPFLGTHNQLQTLRFDKMNLRKHKHPKVIIPAMPTTIDLTAKLNSGVAEIKKQFQGKVINMQKISQIKRTFIKNNRDRKFLKGYFQKHSNDQSMIGVQELKQLVKQYGYDVSEDEAKLMIKLTNSNVELDLPSFINLMAKDNVYFETLKLNTPKGKVTTKSVNFGQKNYIILRNKYSKLKEAMKIYTQRGENVDQQKFDYVMKKLDITDLVMPKAQRKALFNQFADQQGNFNVEGMLCSIAQQENNLKPIDDSSFANNLLVGKEAVGKMADQPKIYNLKRMSNVEYENHLSRIKQVMNEVRKANQEINVINELTSGKIQRQELRKHIELLLQKRGLNFKKQYYDSFISSIDFNNYNQIDSSTLKRFLLEETQEEANQRFERNVRNPPPQSKTLPQFDKEEALKGIKKIKDLKLNPEATAIFKQLDTDKDGFISREEFAKSVRAMNIMPEPQIDNLANYISFEQQGHVDLAKFARIFDESQNTAPPLLRPQRNKAKSCSEWLAAKKNIVQMGKGLRIDPGIGALVRPTKYSAWPAHLHKHDLSLLQPGQHSGMYLSEKDRFNAKQKDQFGVKQREAQNVIESNKLKHIAEWNHKLQMRKNELEQKEIHRNCMNNYKSRMLQERYQQNCHNLF